MPLVLFYNILSPPSRSALFLIHHYKIPCNLKEIWFGEKGTSGETYAKINPNKLVPCLASYKTSITEETPEFVISESRAIMLFLTRNYGKPGDLFYSINDTKKNSKVIEKLCWDMGQFWPKVQNVYKPQLVEQKPCSKKAESEVVQLLSEIDSMLFKEKYVANGELSIADISLAMNIDFVKGLVKGNFGKKYPNIKKWLDEVENMKAWKRTFTFRTNLYRSLIAALLTVLLAFKTQPDE